VAEEATARAATEGARREAAEQRARQAESAGEQAASAADVKSASAQVDRQVSVPYVGNVYSHIPVAQPPEYE